MSRLFDVPAGGIRGFASSDLFRWPLVPMASVVNLHYGKALIEGLRRAGQVPVYGTNGRTGWHDDRLGVGPTVILGRKGMGNLGVEWCPGPFWVIDTAYYTTFDEASVFHKFFFYFTNFVGLNHLKDGTSNPSLSRDVFGRQWFPLPPLPEQVAISALLSALDDKIDLNRQMNSTLEAMARAIFKDWFVDFGPTRAKVEGGAPYLAADIWALFPDRLDDEGKPEGWGEIKIENLLELAYGKSLPAADRREGAVPVYGSGGLTGFHDQSLVDGPAIIVGRKGTVGSLYWEHRSCYPIDTVFYVRSLAPLSYCYNLLDTLRLTEMNTDAAVPGLNRSNVYRLLVPNAPSPLIKAFGVQADTCRAKVVANLSENETLASARDLLLPKLMSGEIRVKDAEKIVEAAR